MILFLLVALFGIKMGSRVREKVDQFERLNKFDKFILNVDNTLEINPFQIVNKVQSLKEIGRPPQKSVPEGVTYWLGKDPVPVNKKFLYSYFQDNTSSFVIELIQLNSNRSIHKWTIPYNKLNLIFNQWKSVNEDSKAGYNISKFEKCRLMIPTNFCDKKLLVNVQGMLICMDKESNILWYQDKFFHHSIEIDHKGNAWVPSYKDALKNDIHTIDQLVKINPNSGKILF